MFSGAESGRKERKKKKRAQSAGEPLLSPCIGAFLLTGVLLFTAFSQRDAKISFSYQHYITFTTILMHTLSYQKLSNVTVRYRGLEEAVKRTR